MAHRKPRSNKNINRNKKIHFKENKNNSQEPLGKHINFDNVTIVGDSHARHIAALTREVTPSSTAVTGVCKPGAGLMNIVPTAAPPGNHCYVLLAGTNDVAAGRPDIIFDNIEAALRRCTESSKILVCPLTTRYDLPTDSTVHDVVRRTNLYISELCGRMEGVEMIDISSISRQLYTAHGLHLRLRGKQKLARLIVDKLASIPSSPPQPTSNLSHLQDTLPPQPLPSAQPPASPQLPRTLPYPTFADAVIGPRQVAIKPDTEDNNSREKNVALRTKSIFLGNSSHAIEQN